MKQKEDFEFKEDNEILEGQSQESLKKLSLYSKILEKEGNIFVKFKRNKHNINLKSNVSYYRVCSLGEICPEESILFTLYSSLTESDSESERQNNKKGIDKLKERLSENEDNKYPSSNKLRYKIKNKNYFKNSESKKIAMKESSKEKERDSVIILDEIKSSLQSIFNKEGSSIGSNYEMYKVTWKNLYKWLLIFPLIILLGQFYFMYKDAYGFSFAEIFCFILVFIISFTSMSGNEKMELKKRVNFNRENIFLYIIISFSFYVLICTNIKIEMAAYKFLTQYRAFVHIAFTSLIILCIIIIYLNKKMITFHRRYSQLLDSGFLLTDRSS